jgi:hypothetical protein
MFLSIANSSLVKASLTYGNCCGGMLMLPPINLNLSLEQEFNVEAARSVIQQASRDDLEAMLLSLMRQNYAHRNAFSSLIHEH